MVDMAGLAFLPNKWIIELELSENNTERKHSSIMKLHI